MIALAHTQAKGMTPGKYLRGRPYRRSGSGDVFGRLIRQQPALTSRRQRRHVSSLIEIQLFICSQQNWEFRPLREIVRDWLQSKAVCFSTKQTRCFFKKKGNRKQKGACGWDSLFFLSLSLFLLSVQVGDIHASRRELLSFLWFFCQHHDTMFTAAERRKPHTGQWHTNGRRDSFNVVETEWNRNSSPSTTTIKHFVEDAPLTWQTMSSFFLFFFFKCCWKGRRSGNGLKTADGQSPLSRLLPRQTDESRKLILTERA